MPKLIDLTGRIFDCLKVLRINNKRDKRGNIMWDCECIICGKLTTVQGNNLKSGTTRSCGDTKNCEAAYSIASIPHITHGLSYTTEFQYLQDMLRRCYDPNFPGFSNWGGRLDINGNPDPIKVHQEWQDKPQSFTDYCNSGQMPETLEEFKARCPGKRATIDRIDNNKDYEPGNIRWATYQEQQQNTRVNVFNEDMIRFTRDEYLKGRSGTEIFELLKSNYNYQGSKVNVYLVIQGKTWTNII